MILRGAAPADKGKIKVLYREAFPKAERQPFWMLWRGVAAGRGTLLVAEENGAFAGFVSLMQNEELVYLNYLAVDAALRCRGAGNSILSLIKEKYAGKRIFLAREPLEKAAENYPQRVQRQAFYQKNGFDDLPCKICEAGVIYDGMGIGGGVTSAEYHALITAWAGPLAVKLLKMCLIEGRPDDWK